MSTDPLRYSPGVHVDVGAHEITRMRHGYFSAVYTGRSCHIERHGFNALDHGGCDIVHPGAFGPGNTQELTRARSALPVRIPCLPQKWQEANTHPYREFNFIHFHHL